VVDADIEGAFDNIDHTYLLATIGQFPAREVVKQWLKAGYVDRGGVRPTIVRASGTAGTTDRRAPPRMRGGGATRGDDGVCGD